MPSPPTSPSPLGFEISEFCGLGRFPGFANQSPGSAGQQPVVGAAVLVPDPPTEPPPPPFKPVLTPPPPASVPDPNVFNQQPPPTITSYQCIETRIVCPEDLESASQGNTVRTIEVFRSCGECNPGIEPGVVNGASGLQVASNGQEAGYVVIAGACVFNTPEECELQCTPYVYIGDDCSVVVIPDPDPTTGLGTTTASIDPTNSIVNSIDTSIGMANKRLTAQNGSVVSVNQAVLPNEPIQSNPGRYTPTLYNPKLNFFNIVEPPNTQTTVNSRNTNIFKRQCDSGVVNLLKYQNESTLPWDESLITNLTDEGIIVSLQPALAEALGNIRSVSGKVIGLSVFVQVIRKHLLEGTINEFNPQYFRNVYESQKAKKFFEIEASDSKDFNEKFTLSFIQKPEFKLEVDKKGQYRNTQMNRFRLLNEDLNIKVSITDEDGNVKFLDLPNEGIPLTPCSTIEATTPASIGLTNRLNLGDGGGYYIDSTDLNGDHIPLNTINDVFKSYYSPALIRDNTLSLLGDFEGVKISASSRSDAHEFIADDPGPSELSPLYFGLNLNSVSGETSSEDMVQTTFASYSRITDTDMIQKHINNNALNVPQVSIDYRDPIYRYILDTSSFVSEISDISLANFQNVPARLKNSNFPRNIPFGFVIVPCAGSDFNPFNGFSKVTSFESIVVRELSLRTAISPGLQSDNRLAYQTYNIFNDDGTERIGHAESKSIHNFGYRFDPSLFSKRFFKDGTLSDSQTPVSSHGLSYLTKDVLDFINDEHTVSEVLWFDVYSRMPFSRIGELMYDSYETYVQRLVDGSRNNIKIKNAESSTTNSPTALSEDARTIVKESDRKEFRPIPI